MTRVGTSFVLLAVVVFLGLPPTASAGDKEEVARTLPDLELHIRSGNDQKMLAYGKCGCRRFSV